MELTASLEYYYIRTRNDLLLDLLSSNKSNIPLWTILYDVIDSNGIKLYEDTVYNLLLSMTDDELINILLLKNNTGKLVVKILVERSISNGIIPTVIRFNIFREELLKEIKNKNITTGNIIDHVKENMKNYYSFDVGNLDNLDDITWYLDNIISNDKDKGNVISNAIQDLDLNRIYKLIDGKYTTVINMLYYLSNTDNSLDAIMSVIKNYDLDINTLYDSAVNNADLGNLRIDLDRIILNQI